MQIKPLDQRKAVTARIPYNADIGHMFGVSDHQWKALVETIYPDATDRNTIALVLSHCAAKGYDPMSKPFHIVGMWNSKSRQVEDTIWPSIGLYRTLATRSGDYAGKDQVAYGPEVTETLTGMMGKGSDRKSADVTVTFPEWAQLTVYKIVSGVRVAFAGPRVKWKEFYSRQGYGNDLPTPQWAQRPEFMLGKVAESQALRSAWPELCDQPTAEEMQAAATGHTPNVVIVDPATEGQEAFINGEIPSDCPYLDDDPNYQIWMTAYLAAERESE